MVASASSSGTSYLYASVLPSGEVPTHTGVTSSPVLPSVRSSSPSPPYVVTSPLPPLARARILRGAVVRRRERGGCHDGRRAPRLPPAADLGLARRVDRRRARRGLPHGALAAGGRRHRRRDRRLRARGG